MTVTDRFADEAGESFKVSKEIPKKFRRQHSAGAFESRAEAGSGEISFCYYMWQSFGGTACLAVTPCGEYSGIKPIIDLYVNGELREEITPSSDYIPIKGKELYEAVFSELEDGDEFYAEVIFDVDHCLTVTHTYRGSSGAAPTLEETDEQISAELFKPYLKNYSMALGVFEFDEDFGALNKYSREARTRLVESCLQSTETDAVFGKAGNLTSFELDQYDAKNDEWTYPDAFTHEAQIYKFDDISEENTAKVGIVSSASANFYDDFSEYVDEWIDDVNKLLGKVLFVRDDGISDEDFGISIRIGSHEALFGYSPEENIESGEYVKIFFGQWERTRWYPSSGGTHHCDVRLCNELRGVMKSASDFRNIVYEELTECLGCGNDTFEIYDSIFSEIWYVGKTNNLILNGAPTYDGEVVQMLYNELETGEKMSELVFKLTPKRSCVVQLPCVKWGNIRGKGYSVRAWAMNRKVAWTVENGREFWNWNDVNNSFSDIEDGLTDVVPAYSTPKKAPVILECGANYIYVDVGDELNAYIVKAVDGDGNERISSALT